MAPKKYLCPVLLLAGSASASLFNGRINNLAANNVVNARAIATTDAGYKACATVSAVVMSCSKAGSIADNVPEATQKACVCCNGQNELDPVYSSCAAYVNTALQAPSLAQLYNDVFTVCAGYKCGAAAAPSTTTSPSSVTTAPTTSKATITSAPVIPAACNSVVSIASRCEGSAGDDKSAIVSCLCHDTSGKTNTQIQNWASSCLPWAEKESTEDVTALEAFESICTAGLPSDDDTSSTTQSSSGQSNRPAFAVPSTAGSVDEPPRPTQGTGGNAEQTYEPAGVSSSRSSAAGVGMGVQHQPLGGVARWVVNGLVAVAGLLVV
ncbi:hypothetical protein B0T20DRAFT_203527 [Sordaria brevicollis]|uniref:Uncharacterized protein n=1 Tax=Sordaria brevicollis TaxID=83679 RepID=A0AAE0PE69_SORBR|nr:hypothetical protein B0T20DRAFT_203527 [Sordaria brevicollis]